MWRPSTLRIRFALWVAGLLLAALLAFSGLVYFALARSLSSAIDASLQLSASQAIAAVNIEDGQINFSDSVPEDAALAGLRERGLTIRVLSPAGRLLQAFGPYRGLPVRAAEVASAAHRQSTFTTLAHPPDLGGVRVFTAPIVDKDRVLGVVQVAQTLRSVQEPLDRLLAALLVSIPLLSGIAGLGGYLLAARALRPIDQITRIAQRTSVRDLHARLNLPVTDDEVGRLAATFDHMLARLDESFQRERQFTADASHELRTPVTAMQAILEVTRTVPRTAREYELALDDLSSETDRLRGLVEHLLQLARGETAPSVTPTRVDLSALLHNVCDSLRPLAEAKELTLSDDVPDELCVLADNDALIRLFVNLLDNAIRYTHCGGVTVSAMRILDEIKVTVHDTGIGIAAEHVPRIFDRFYRADTARRCTAWVLVCRSHRRL